MGKIKPGMQAEYKRRHDAIWPEMKALLKSAGIRNYSIWSDGELVFGYYECERGIAEAGRIACCRALECVYGGCAGAGDESGYGRTAEIAADVPAGMIVDD